MRLSAFLVALLTLVAARPAGAQLAPPNAAGVTFGHVHLSVKDAEVKKKLFIA